MKISIDSVIIGSWAKTDNAKNILDIGTGTGILALMMAQKSEATIDAVEIDTVAYNEALENFTNSPFSKQIKCYNTDIKTFAPSNKYDLIISNPPYFDENVHSDNKQRDMARNTKSLSHDALFENIVRLLDDDGTFYLILPFSKDKIIKEIAAKSGLFCEKQLIISGKASKQVNRIVYQFSRKNSDTVTEQLFVYNEDGKYSEQFKWLTENYYLPSIFR